MDTTKPSQPAIDHGQRVAGETRFEAAPGQINRIRFTHPVIGALPPDEHSSSTPGGRASAADSAMTAAVASAPSASVWEGREDDEVVSASVTL
ncbi:MAG: hypothetical protein P4L73_09140 [Caulobacteraceae bacterium]|nr:hypothetical protein [Caulobacteraceae bacterium]